jgi:hypothetical protein
MSHPISYQFRAKWVYYLLSINTEHIIYQASSQNGRTPIWHQNCFPMSLATYAPHKMGSGALLLWGILGAAKILYM